MEQPSSPSQLRELTSGLARGDDAAWTEFHRNYGPLLFRQFLAATWGDHDLASEALQHAYLRIARHARPCDSAPMFVAWLRLVGRSALADCRRSKRRFWQWFDHRDNDTVAPSAIDQDREEKMQAALDRALGQLDPDSRTLLETKYVSGTDVRSLAAKLEISEKAVESRLTRARAELRRLLLLALSRDE